MEDVQFQNMDSWKGSSSNKYGLTYKQICLMHINRCVINGSVEWHGGYWQRKSTQNTFEEYYVQNSRNVYANSVKMLRALLIGYFDTKMQDADKLLEEEYKIEYAKYKPRAHIKENLSEWYMFQVDWHVRLFEQLIMLSKRLNFFEEESSEEEI